MEKIDATKKIEDAKLDTDFQTVLKEFQKAQSFAAVRETAYTPFVPHEVHPSNYIDSEVGVNSNKNQEHHALLLESHEVVFLDNEISFNEAIIEEREQGHMVIVIAEGAGQELIPSSDTLHLIS